MKIKRIFLGTGILVLFLLCLACGGMDSIPQDQNEFSNTHRIETLANNVCENVGTVSRVSGGNNGTPVIVLEENHISRQGQLQHAVTLVRLHDKYGLKDIALEGYLIENKKINTDWYTRAANENQAAKIQVAIRLLKEGEISCAEFMKLIYDDINLHPIDKTSQYSVELDDEATKAPMLFLVKIAQQSLKQEHLPQIEQLQKEIGELEGKQKQEKVNELLDYILSVDPWVKEKDEILHQQNSSNVISLKKMFTVVEEIENRARELGVTLDPGDKEAMNRNLDFWQARLRADETMLLATGKIADESKSPVVAMIIGAAHSEQISKMLKKSGRPFAVITPNSLKNIENPSDLTWDMLNRKYKRQSVYTEGFTGILLKSFIEENLKKPEPVLSEPWLQAKSELYLFTDRITRKLLEGASPPPPKKPPQSSQMQGLPLGDNPPFGFSEDEFRGNWVYIDPNRLSITYDTDEQKQYAVLIPVILNPNDETKRKEIWIKSIYDFFPVQGNEQENVEYLLKKALEEIESQQEESIKKQKNQVEDKGGRVQITINTKAIITSSRYDAVTRSVAGEV